MTPDDDTSSLATIILAGYEEYRQRFSRSSRRAAAHFEARAWAEAQEDARERILLYDVLMHETLTAIGRGSGSGGGGGGGGGGGRPGTDEAIEARAAFAERVRGRPDSEVAETFFNSVVRRLYGTVGVDPAIEFVADDLDDPPQPSGDRPPWNQVALDGGFEVAIRQVLHSLPLEGTWHQHEERIGRAARHLRADLGPDQRWTGGVLQTLRPLFFRNKAAYVVGRFANGSNMAPLILAITHPPTGLQLDAVLTSEDDASVVFGFTRSYLHGDVGAPRPVVDFLRSVMPMKRVDELYTAIGFHRHGKTELYRTLIHHLREPGNRFEPTPGQKGLVMCVFTMPDLNVVFKVIRDHFAPPKSTTRHTVMRNYRLVFVRDRVGRLADAQQFERLELPADRFSADVLDELLESAGRTVSVAGDTVTIDHLYTERRVHPLDLYLREVGPDEALRVTLDFGQAIKDLAAADIFPGDMLVKNFGVTRHGRVIFYDYDEVAPVTALTFRTKPRAAYPEAELADDPPFYVGPADIFPEEWRPFLGPPGRLRQELHRHHPELLDPAWWRRMQEHHRAGEIVDFYPYPPERRLDD